MKISLMNVREMLARNQEDIVNSYIKTFSCEREKNGVKESLNPQIEKFLFNNAVKFSKKKTAISYLVIDEEDSALLGYFALAHKPIKIPAEGLSRNVRDQLKRFSKLEDDNSFMMSGFFLAQFGKNFAVDNGTRISGAKLMKLVNEQLRLVQDIIGGTLVYLDCEPNARLISFYEKENFKLFGERVSETDGKRYLQYLTFV